MSNLTKRLSELRAKASQGKWGFKSATNPDEDGYFYIRECDVLEPTGIQHTDDYDGYWHDWALIVETINALPKLLRIIEIQGEALNELRKQEIVEQMDMIDKTLQQIKKIEEEE